MEDEISGEAHPIAAIAKCEGVTAIYSDDDDISRISRRLNINVIKIDALPLPEIAKQGKLELAP